jgi:outer membrane protein OmpA-like peptidoglycan-associated protein
MRISQAVAGALATIVVAVPGLALADNTLSLSIGGEAFDGPPKFAVSFDGKQLGENAVAAAIDTATDGRFADAADKHKYMQSFTFSIPEALFKPDAEIAIQLTNEAHGAPGSKNDRQLYVASVAVNGDMVAAAKFGMRSSVGVEPTAMLGDYLVVSQGKVEGIVAAPSGGWPRTDTPVADAAAKPAAAEASPPEPTPDEAMQVATAAPADAAPVPMPAKLATVAAATPGRAEVTEASVQPVAAMGDAPTDGDSAELNPQPEADLPDCGINTSFQIIGFSENSNDLTPKTHRSLDRVVKAIGAQRCVVHLTGYSSTEGRYADNALFSIERAQNALHYLAAQGVRFRRYSANGVGETTQFGSDPEANRRVVVTITP